MGWKILNVTFAISETSMPCDGGLVTATITVTGETDHTDANNSYTASIRDDYVIPDTLWTSGEISVGPDAIVNDVYPVQISCDSHGHVIGPDGSSHERVAELYAYVLSEDLESGSNEIAVTCEK